MTNERARFELYFSDAHNHRDGDTYDDVHADIWEGWKARGESDAAVADLPAPEPLTDERIISAIDETGLVCPDVGLALALVRIGAALSTHPTESDSESPEAADDGLLERALEWIRSSPHGDNCFLHDDGGEYDRCFCGKDALLDFAETQRSSSGAGSDDKEEGGKPA